METGTPRVDLDQMIFRRILLISRNSLTENELAQRLEELLWLRDQVKKIPYSNGSTKGIGE